MIIYRISPYDLFAETHTGLPCFRQLVTILKRLSREDIDTLTVKYLQKTQSEVVRQTMIDALGTAHTADCYTVMMQHVFHTKRPEANLLMRALFQLVDLSAPTPEVKQILFVDCMMLGHATHGGHILKSNLIISIN